MNKIETVGTNEISVIVEPRLAGNYGFMHISGIERSATEEKHLAEQIISGINRHVDNVQHAYVSQKRMYVVDGIQYENFIDALEAVTGLDAPHQRIFHYRYERPNDNGVGSTGVVSTFEEVCKKAYDNPWKFVVKGVSDEEQEFINGIINFRLGEKKMYYKATSENSSLYIDAASLSEAQEHFRAVGIEASDIEWTIVEELPEGEIPITFEAV